MRDETAANLRKLGPAKYRHDMLAEQVVGKMTENGPDYQIFLGSRNLGVSGNTNRALKWFIEETKADHLCIMNDDLHVLGDFVQFYWNATCKVNIHLWCFCDFTSETYKWVPIKVKAANAEEFDLKLLPRMTGIMMSVTRKLIEQVGYFDVTFGPFGEEHCDFTNRARFSGAMRLQGQDLHCLDVAMNPELLRHQEVESSIMPYEKPGYDAIAATAMVRASRSYLFTSWYRPFRLYMPKFAGAYESSGIDTGKMSRTELVIN